MFRATWQSFRYPSHCYSASQSNPSRCFHTIWQDSRNFVQYSLLCCLAMAWSASWRCVRTPEHPTLSVGCRKSKENFQVVHWEPGSSSQSLSRHRPWILMSSPGPRAAWSRRSSSASWGRGTVARGELTRAWAVWPPPVWPESEYDINHQLHVFHSHDLFCTCIQL